MLMASMIRTLFLAAMLFAAPALSQPSVPCGPVSAVLRGLLDHFGEVPLLRGVAGGASFIITLSFDGNWTLLRVEGDTACVVVSGKNAKLDPGV